MTTRAIILSFISALVFLVAITLYLFVTRDVILMDAKTHTPQLATPTPFIFITYTPAPVEKKEVYKIAMIGDSMTAALGPHGGELSEYLNTLYKRGDETNQRILIDNYAISSNILAVGDQLNKKISVSEYTFGPLLADDYDVLLIESYGYNPLSQFGIDEGLMRQTKALDTLVTEILQKRPQTYIIFVATIAPNKSSYGQATQPDSTLEDRVNRAEERIRYITNHITYASKHNIPLINIYEKSLTSTGEGNKKYINPTDNIHPSFAGITLIKNEIADYIFTNTILPL